MPDTNDPVEQDAAPDAKTAAAALTARYGDAQRAAERLYEINERLSRKIERLEQRPELPEGGRVLTATEAAAYDALAALGAADELTAALSAGREASEKLATMQRREAARAAARALGWNEEALYRMPGADTLAFETQNETEDGKPVQVPYVVPAEGGRQKLADYAAANADWLPLLPALQQSTAATGNTNGTRYTSQGGDARGSASAYDPAAEGKRMAERARAARADDSLALR